MWRARIARSSIAGRNAAPSTWGNVGAAINYHLKPHWSVVAAMAAVPTGSTGTAPMGHQPTFCPGRPVACAEPVSPRAV
jgi:hypothetical protein